MKTYKLINEFYLATTIMVGGKPRSIEFSGGSRNAGVKGFFATDNPALQKAIEADSGYGKVFTDDRITDPGKSRVGGIDYFNNPHNAVFSDFMPYEFGPEYNPVDNDPISDNSTELKSDAEPQAKNPYYELLPDKQTAIFEDTVTSRNTAIAWLQVNKGATFEGSSVDEVKREAAEKYNLLFTKWK